MTDANRESCNGEGENDDRRIDDLLAVCVVEDAAGFAVEETFDATPFGVFFLPIAVVSSDMGCEALRKTLHGPRVKHECAASFTVVTNFFFDMFG